MRNLVLFGPPGSGKGTQAARLVEHHGLHAISTGELLRRETAARSQLGIELEERLAAGELVPDEIVTGLLDRELWRYELTVPGFIFDGYPRTAVQARSLAELLHRYRLMINAVFVLELPDDLLIERVSGRLACRGCGRGFHDTFDPPPLVCCPGGFTRRAEDNADALRVRLARYHSNIKEVLGEFVHHPHIHTLDASRHMNEVAHDIDVCINSIEA